MSVLLDIPVVTVGRLMLKKACPYGLHLRKHAKTHAAKDVRPPGGTLHRSKPNVEPQMTKLLTLHIDKSDDDCFNVVCTSMAGDMVTEVQIPRDAHFADLKHLILSRVRCDKGSAVGFCLPDGTSLCQLRSSFLVKDVPDLNQESIGDEDSLDEMEELPKIKQRNLKRKRDSDARVQRKRANRNANKRALRDALKSAAPKCKASPNDRTRAHAGDSFGVTPKSMATGCGSTSKASPATPSHNSQVFAAAASCRTPVPVMSPPSVRTPAVPIGAPLPKRVHVVPIGAPLVRRRP